MTEMDISSVSKTVTATAILHLLQSQPGGLDAALSTPLADYLPSDWTPGANVQFVTLRHLLTHTSGFSESNNPIGVNFGSPSNATYVNLRNLVEADLGAPTVGFDSDYHGPRWGGSYNNANFALLAQVVLPKLINPGINLTAANYADRDLTSGTMYKEYVQDEIFEPLGIVGADLDVDRSEPDDGICSRIGGHAWPGAGRIGREPAARVAGSFPLASSPGSLMEFSATTASCPRRLARCATSKSWGGIRRKTPSASPSATTAPTAAVQGCFVRRSSPCRATSRSGF